MSERLRCGIIGFEFGHQLAFAGALARNLRAEIVGVANLPGDGDEARQRAENFAEQQVVPHFDAWQELLDAEVPEAVSVCAPPSRNPDIVAELASRGVHVMSEKPVAADLDGVRRIAAAVHQAGIAFTFGFHAARFARPVQRAISAVRGGEVGAVRVLNGMFLQTKGPRYTISVEEARRRRAAGEPSVGELANFGGYLLLAFSAYAEARVTSVYAEMDAFLYESYRIAGIEDMALLSLQYDTGVVGTATLGRTTTKSLPATDARHEIIGSGGVLHVDHALGDRVFVYGQFRDDDPYERGGFQTPTFSRPSHELYVDDFVDAALLGRQTALTVGNALELERTLQAAYHSARLHQPIDPRELM